MKIQRLFILLITVISMQQLQGQREIQLIENAIQMGEGVTFEQRVEIVQISKDIMNKYYQLGALWDEETNAYSNEKYGEFLNLFLGSADVFDDIGETGLPMSYSDYADIIFEQFTETKLRYEIDEPYLTSIYYDDVSGSYISVIEFEKVMFNGLDKDGNYTTSPEGKIVDLTMEIDFPGYDFNDARIARIRGKETRVEEKTKESITYYSLSASYGLGLPSAKPVNDVFATAFEGYSLSGNSFGANFNIRKSLGRGNTNFIFGLGAKIIKLTTDISTYDNEVLPLDARPKANILERLSLGFGDLAPPTNQSASLIVEDFGAGIENISILAVEAPIGMSIRLKDEVTYDIFVDFAVVPIFNLSYTGDVDIEVRGIKIPDSDHFPEEEFLSRINANPTLLNDEYNDYRSTESLDQKALKSKSSTFSLGLSVSPTYTMEIDDSYGLEFGLNLWYNILPLFKEPDPPTGGYLKNLIPDESPPSVLDSYFKNVSTLLINFKVGFFYKFDSTLNY